MRLIQSLASKELVRNLHTLNFDQHFCMLAKLETTHSNKVTKALELLHMDLFGPSAVRSYGGNHYTLVIVDDYSRKIEESLNVTFDETPPPSKTSTLVDDDLDEEEAIREIKKKNLENVVEDETLEIDEIVTMPPKFSKDHKNTRHYIPQISYEFRSPIKEKLRNLKECYIHEGQMVFDNFTDLRYVRSLFHFVEFECLLEINEQVCPCFILEFYSQYRLSYSDEGQMFVEFVIQNQYFSLCLEDFAQILKIPCEGAYVFSDRWSLDELVYGTPLEGPYQTNLPSLDDIVSYVREDRKGQVTRNRHQEEIEVQNYQILTREIVATLKPLEEIIRENVFCLGGNWDHVPECLCYMLYCVANSEKFNLAYFMAKRMEWVTNQARLILPYGMLLTRLFDFIISEYSELKNESYVLYDHVMTPFAAQLERKPRRDRGTRRGRRSTSSSSAFDQPSSSHINDDDDNGNDEGTSRASTPSPIRYVNSLTNQIPQIEYCEDKDDCFTNFESEFPAIVLDDTSREALSWEPTVSPLNDNEIDFRISFNESDDEDYMPSGDMSVIPLPNIINADAGASAQGNNTATIAETMIWYMLKKTCVKLIRYSEALVNTLFAQELIMENYHEQNIKEFSVLILFSLII
ncbi:hypothetical protein Tco_0299361 [Tanacetum coccineum]